MPDQNFTFHLPEASKWGCWLGDTTVWYPPKGEEPNAFHRFMQRLCFGVKWKRKDG